MAVGQRRSSPASLALVVVRFLAAGMTSPLREMADAARRWPRATSQPRHRDLARRDRRRWRGRSTRWRPSSPRPTACAAISSPTSATSCARRSPRCRPCSRTSSTGSRPPTRRRSARCWRRSSGSAGSSAAPRPLPARVGRGAARPARVRGRARCSSTRCASSGCTHPASTSPSWSRRPRLTADGDPERVHQVVANLVENAVRHTPTGGRVEVRARAANGRISVMVRPSSTVTIEVSDEGPGIPEAEDGPRVRTLLPRRHRPVVG